MLFGSTAVCLVLAECVLRMVVPENGFPSPPGVAEVDPYAPNPFVFKFRPYLWSYIPHSHFLQVRGDRRIPYDINAAGFRGRPIEAKQRKRILVVGDSVVEGQGVRFEETFAERLSDNLQDAGWEALNTGVSGASPVYYAANLERYFSFSPDAMLFVLFENDIHEDRVREAEYRTLPRLDTAAMLTGGAPSVLGSLRIVELLSRMRDRLPSEPVKRMVVKSLGDRRPLTPLDNDYSSASPHLVGPDSYPHAFRSTARYLEYIRKELEKRHIKMLVASFGFGIFEEPVETKHRAFVKQFNDSIAAWSASKKVPYAGLQPVVDQVISGHPRDWSILPNDGHPSGNAHQELAQALLPFVKQSVGAEASAK